MGNTYIKIVDFSDRIDKLLNEKPKSGSRKEWQKKWDKLMEEAFKDEEPKRKKGGEKRKEEAGEKKDVGDVRKDMEGTPSL